MSYIILEDQQCMDGVLYHSKAALFKALPYANSGSKVLSFDMSEVLRDSATPMRDVSEEIVIEAYAAGVFDDPETHRLGIAGDFVSFPDQKYVPMLEQVA